MSDLSPAWFSYRRESLTSDDITDTTVWIYTADLFGVCWVHFHLPTEEEGWMGDTQRCDQNVWSLGGADEKKIDTASYCNILCGIIILNSKYIQQVLMFYDINS